jgi:predicted nucleotidyltransferase
MTAAEKEKIEASLRAFFLPRSDVAAAYLFGSVARGTAGAASDVDVGVLFAAPRPSGLEGLPVDIEDELTRAVGRRVQVVDMRGAPADLVHRVLRDGILVCEHDRRARVVFEVQRRNEYFDLLPILRQYRRAGRHPS